MDKRIGSIIRAVKESGLEESTVIILSSDHGGVGKGHGGKSLEEILIPWVAMGKDIKTGHEIQDLVMTFDTGATIAFPTTDFCTG